MSQKIPKGYTSSSTQEFRTFGEAIKLLEDYCKICRYSRCDVEKALRGAMGENYPMWNRRFVRITAESFDTPSNEADKVICLSCNPKKESQSSRKKAEDLDTRLS